jgi:hypothetical protein
MISGNVTSDTIGLVLVGDLETRGGGTLSGVKVLRRESVLEIEGSDINVQILRG